VTGDQRSSNADRAGDPIMARTMDEDERMGTVLAAIGIAGLWLVPVGLLLGAVYFHRHPQRRPVGRGFGVLDEIYRPTAHTATEIRKDEQVRPAPAPTPGDPPMRQDNP
jgi:hypothetical protein